MLLEVKKISFSYECIKALENVSFKAKAGRVLGIIGPNASGKTTLLRCINRVLKPKVGTVLIDGKEISKWDRREIARKIGVVPQRSGTFPFNAFDIVLMGRFPHLRTLDKEGPGDLKVVRRAMELTNTLHLAERPIDELSGGEIQRVIIARALAQEPQVLLLDEPTLHLDICHQLEILDLIRRITSERELVTILVSHDLNLASRYCDSLILLNSGKIHSIGLTGEVLTPEKIGDVYGVNVHIEYNPIIKANQIVPVSSRR